MTTIVKSANNAGVSLFDAVGSVTEGIARTLDAAAKSSQLLDQFINNAVENQAIRYKIERVDYTKKLILESAEEVSDIEVRILRKVQGDEERTVAFKAAVARLEAAVQP